MNENKNLQSALKSRPVSASSTALREEKPIIGPGKISGRVPVRGPGRLDNLVLSVSAV